MIEDVIQASQVDFEEGGVEQQTLDELRSVRSLFVSSCVRPNALSTYHNSEIVIIFFPSFRNYIISKKTSQKSFAIIFVLFGCMLGSLKFTLFSAGEKWGGGQAAFGAASTFEERVRFISHS